MQIFTAILESWTVPGQHVQSFVKREAAEAWLREQFAEYLLSDLQEELEDEDSGVNEIDEWSPGAVERVLNGTGNMVDYEEVIESVNLTKSWSGSLTILESELDISAEIAAERERIAACLDEEAGLIPCTEDAMVTRSDARLVRADFSYEEADRLAEAEEH
ncbi:hypothetical protein KL86PLE_90701 [uncultured Pleomorphomonas sp.]|uniref:Uncharacterized protein n=1 Tax=uncultured Pleomorphomonas sp. TaxID=442121 RepID=A0A212LQW6_9HYPH|nr:hypothetical protein [uncultured Pleomorphomonas sp.]SCM79906.1 hypothetical protein KL86PLE_90701 [uncultured Pleomorphomonas sp.]